MRLRTYLEKTITSRALNPFLCITNMKMKWQTCFHGSKTPINLGHKNHTVKDKTTATNSLTLKSSANFALNSFIFWRRYDMKNLTGSSLFNNTQTPKAKIEVVTLKNVRGETDCLTYSFTQGVLRFSKRYLKMPTNRYFYISVICRNYEITPMFLNI